MDERIALLKNTVIGQKYYIVSEIGRGGSCIVYEAEYIDHIDLKHRVRIKEFYPYQVKLKREEDGKLSCIDQKAEKVFEEKRKLFVSGYYKNIELQYDDDFMNTSVDAREIMEDNGTVYLVYSVDGGMTLDKYKPKGIRECVELTIAVARAVEKYHKKEYLHLDIKPANIFVLDDIKDMVKLFDYDSVAKISDVKSGYSKISYSEGFSAPELIRGNVTKIGYGTDVFSIGAVLYAMLWEKAPDYSSMDFGAKYDFESISREYLDKTIREDVYVKLTEFFHKTLSSMISKRYKAMEDVIVILQEIYELADSHSVYIVSSIPPKRFFIGRKREKAEIEKILKDNQIVILSGIGGIGKSILAEDYILDHREEYDNIILTSMTEGLVELVCDDNKIALSNFQIKEDESLKAYAKRKLKKLRELCNEKTLFLIDNMDTIDFDEDEWIWRELLSMNLKIIVTSRIAEWSYPVVKISELENNEKIMLFKKYCDSEEDEYIEKIIEIVQGHTALIELIAKQIDTSFTTAEEMYHILKETGVVNTGNEKVLFNKDNTLKNDTVQKLIKAIFDTSTITRRELYILHNLCLFSQDGLSAQEFKEYIDESNFNNIKNLERKGWIQKKKKNISLHTVISDVIRCDGEEVLDDAEVLIDKCVNVYKKILPASKGNVRIEYKKKFEGIARYIIFANVYNRKTVFFIDIYASWFNKFENVSFCKKICLYLINADKRFVSKYTETQIKYTALLVDLYFENEEYKMAFINLRRVLEMTKVKYGDKHPMICSLYMYVGYMCMKLKKYEDAEDWYYKAYLLFDNGDNKIEKKLEKKLKICLLSGIGVLNHYYKPEKAEMFLIEALNLAREEDRNKKVSSLIRMECTVNLAEFYITIERYKDAFLLLQEAKQICDLLFDGKGKIAIRVYEAIAKYYVATEDFDKEEEIKTLVKKLCEEIEYIYGEDYEDD